MDYCKLGEVYNIALAHNKKYPNNNSAYHIMTRITEEVGELAEQVNHFEGSGIKKQKYGEPNKDHLAEEMWHVIKCVYQLCEYYGVIEEMQKSIDMKILSYKKQGLIE